MVDIVMVTEGTRTLDMCVSTNLAVANSFFKKDINKLITSSSGGTETQIDYILTRHANLKHIENIKVICGEKSALQHRLLVGDFKLCTKLKPAKSHIRKMRKWKLKRPDVRLEYILCVQEALTNFNGENVNDCWDEIKSCLLNACDKTCTWTKGAPSCKETW